MEINKPIAIVLLVIIDLMLVFLFVVPKYNESNDLQMNLAKKQAQYKAQADYQVNLLSTLKEIESRQDALYKIESALPEESSLGSLMYFFEQKAKENQLNVTSLTKFSTGTGKLLSATASQKEVQSTTFTSNLSGMYENVKNFLFTLDTSSRLIKVETISFVPSNTLPKGNYDFRLEFKMYGY